MATPIVAPYVPTYAALEPYITRAEFDAGATGINTSQLVPGGTPQQNTDALDQKILAASGDADGICNQTLACTTEVLVGSYKVIDGVVKIPLPQAPIVQVNSISIGTAGSMVALTDLSRVTFPSPNVIQVPYTARSGTVDVQVEYLAGFANARTSSATLVGAVSVPVTNTRGMVAGLALTIGDPGNTETIVVQSVTSTTITPTAALTKAHAAAGVSVSALPQFVKQAVILLTADQILSRGSEAVVLSSMAGGATSKQSPVPGPDRVAAARRLLLQVTRVA